MQSRLHELKDLERFVRNELSSLEKGRQRSTYEFRKKSGILRPGDRRSGRPGSGLQTKIITFDKRQDNQLLQLIAQLIAPIQKIGPSAISNSKSLQFAIVILFNNIDATTENTGLIFMLSLLDTKTTFLLTLKLFKIHCNLRVDKACKVLNASQKDIKSII